MPPQRSSFPTLHRIKDLDGATLDDLSLIIQSFPVIDNHAHNLLREDHADDSSEFPFESITSEAQGTALVDHVSSSLPHIRAIKQLAQLYDCSESIREVKAARYDWIRRDYEGLIKTCLEGTHAILMDDGLNRDAVSSYRWHKKFIPRVSRIVRIEVVAAELLEQLALVAGLLKPGTDADWERDQTEAFFIRFNVQFRNQIRAFANDPDVCGFKSVICYRTGLDITLASQRAFRPQQSLTESDLLAAFHEFLQQAVKSNNYRIQRKEFNDYLVVAVCDVLNKLAGSEGDSPPFQFHTGLGDSDIHLVTANPAYMQPLIEAYPNVDFVLLHSSYPYTREAGYLASVYPNAWLDIGEVFPMLSRDGQESVLKQALEVAPTSKILWSTDGHFFPETYWLANRQFRETLDRLLHTAVIVGDFSVAQAIDIAVDIMFWNSNSLYKLGEDRKYPHLVGACGRPLPEASMRTLVNRTSEVDSLSTSVMRPASTTTLPLSRPVSSRLGRAASNPTPTALSRPLGPHFDVEALDRFLTKHPAVKYIWLQFLDYTATQRLRMVPIGQFQQQLISGDYIGISNGVLRMLQANALAAGGSATGQFLIQPDMSTLVPNLGLDSPSATVRTWWLEDGSKSHHEGCPRWALQRQVNLLRAEYNISILTGYEMEVVFMRPQVEPSTNAYTGFLPLQTHASWCNMTCQQLDILPIAEEIVATLAEVEIYIPQFHTEAAPGQWEFPLPAAEPLKAVDMLYTARNIISNVVRKHGLRATLYPRPYSYSCGNACHTHFSVNGPDDTVAKFSDGFLAGVLEHLPAIMALTLPLEESYERICAGIWAGGEYVAWGTQNRETPVRKCGDGHWELRAVDGVANMYLGTAALLASGLDGLRRKFVLRQKDCAADPSSITEEERRQLGVERKLPRSLQESLKELEKDEALLEALGRPFVADYLAIKKKEVEILGAMGEEERRIWLIERY